MRSKTGHIKPKVEVLDPIFPWWLSPCIESKVTIDSRDILIGWEHFRSYLTNQICSWTCRFYRIINVRHHFKGKQHPGGPAKSRILGQHLKLTKKCTFYKKRALKVLQQINFNYFMRADRIQKPDAHFV